MNDSTLTGYLSWKESAPVAKYTAEVLVNGKSIKTFDFEVADPTAAAVTAPNSARFADAKPVSSKTNLVQVLVPGDWAVTDTSAPDEATMDFLAPDNTGYYAVSAFKVKTAPDAAALRSQLDKYLDGTYKTDTTYKGAPSTTQDDGSGRKLFTLNVKLTDGVVHPFVGQASIKFSNGVLVLRRMMVEKTVLESNRDAMGNMTDYLKIATPAASAPASAAAANDPIAMDDMGTYSHPSGAFSISVPKAWKVLDESANGSVIVNFVEPGARAFYGVEALKTNEVAAPTQDALKTALGLYFTKAYGDKPNLRTDQVQFPSEGVARMTFAYDIDIQGHTTRMVGAVYLLRQGASVSFLRSVAPSSDVTRLRDAFNTVGYSYRVVAAKLP